MPEPKKVQPQPKTPSIAIQAVEKPHIQLSPERELYEQSLRTDSDEQTLPVQLVIGDSNTVYSTDMPISMIYAILDPDIADAFIRLRTLTVSSGTPPAMGKHKFLHTSYIREVILQQDLPERSSK